MTLPLVTADERARLLAHGRRSPLASTSTRCPWCGCSPRRAHVTWLLVSLDPG